MNDVHSTAPGRSRIWRLTKAGQLEPNPLNYETRAGTFAGSAPRGTILLTRRNDDGSGMSHFIILPRADSTGDTALSLATAVAARSAAVEDSGPLLESPRVGVMEYESGSIVARENLAGVDPAELSRILAMFLAPGEWVAAVTREPRNLERKHYRAWLHHQIGAQSSAHHSNRQAALITSFYAGAATRSRVSDILKQLSSAMAGFDVQIKPKTFSNRSALTTLVLMTLGLFGIGFASVLGSVVLPAAIPNPLVFGGAWGLLATVIAIAKGLPVTALNRLNRLRRRNQLPAAADKLFWIARPRDAKVGHDGQLVRESAGSYPLASTGFLIAPAIATGIVAPHGGSASGAAVTKVRPAPPELSHPIGPYLGTSADEDVYLSAADAWQGVIALGVAGSGKTKLLNSIYGAACLNRARPGIVPGYTGKHTALIAFGLKGADADNWMKIADVAGSRAIRFELASSTTPAINLFPPVGSVNVQARAIVNALKYTYDDGSIQGHSFDMLTRIFVAALVVTEELAAQVPGLETGKSPFFYAAILLGDRGDVIASELASTISSAAMHPDTTTEDLVAAAHALTPLYTGRTPANREADLKAPRNKVRPLLTAEDWWSRQFIRDGRVLENPTFDQILSGFLNVVINFGAPQDENAVALDDELTQQMQALTMYALYEAIQRTCVNWQDQRKSVGIFSDELQMLAGNKPTVFSWIRNQGRAYGVCACFGSQYHHNLEPEVRDAVMSFGTLLCFTQDNEKVVDSLVANLRQDGSDWSSEDLVTLPPYEAIVRTRYRQQRQSPFTVKIHDFESDLERFAERQGY